MGKRILLVDDDPHLLSTVQAFLNDEKFQVFLARNYDEALEKIQKAREEENRFTSTSSTSSCLENGLELGKEIRRRTDNTPMLFVTGVFKNQGNQSIALRELRAHAFILKPFGGEELLECMRNIFGSQHPDTAAQTPVTPRPDGAKNTAELPKDGLCCKLQCLISCGESPVKSPLESSTSRPTPKNTCACFSIGAAWRWGKVLPRAQLGGSFGSRTTNLSKRFRNRSPTSR